MGFFLFFVDQFLLLSIEANDLLQHFLQFKFSSHNNLLAQYGHQVFFEVISDKYALNS